ncbi:ATP-binding cassette domain-containing protein [Marinilabiliaceae bacterium ANBcel2]|nr:ATP-binding cassette domain-containing protein [Marinilabiliaceae bacterium ANBcel2]
MNQIIARLKNVTAGYNGESVLKEIFLEIKENDFIGIIGPNGGGKTTMLKVLLGIIEPFRGNVDFPLGKINMGYLPQASQIDKNFPISVKEVVEAGLKPTHRWSHQLSKSQKESALGLIKEAGMERYYKKPIGVLSGGQLQKVLLCRAIASNPQLLVLDEPNTYVDKHFESELHQWLKKLNEKMAILLVSHDVGTIPSLVKSIACVNGTLHYHPSNQLTLELLKVYDCPIDLITHGPVPHRVLKKH